MDEPLEHVVRPSPPWATTKPKTECGRLLNDVAAWIGYETLAAKIKKQGKTRAAMTTCMSCWNALAYRPMGHRSTEWNADPGSVLARYISSTRVDDTPTINRELLALATLVLAHYDEYVQLVHGLEDVGTIGVTG